MLPFVGTSLSAVFDLCWRVTIRAYLKAKMNAAGTAMQRLREMKQKAVKPEDQRQHVLQEKLRRACVTMATPELLEIAAGLEKVANSEAERAAVSAQIGKLCDLSSRFHRLRRLASRPT